MSEKETPSGDAAELRRRAEEMARGKAAEAPENPGALSSKQVRRTLHELRVHQIELEMQNEELRRAQAELDAARARYFDFYDLAPVGFCTVSEQGLMLEANLTAAGWLGEARGALVRQPIARFILQEDQGIYYRRHKQLFETGAAQACELRMVGLNRAAFWVRLEATAAQDAGGASVGRVVMSDITESKRAEEALRESEERYRRIVETAREGIWVIDVEGKVSYANQRIAEMLEYPQAEVVGRPVAGFIAPEHHELSRQNLARRRQGIQEQYEFTFLRRTGSPLHALVSTNPLYDQAGRYAGALGMLTDITERKRAEEALARGRAEMKAIYDHAPVMMCVVDADRRVLYANPAFTAFAGASEDGLKGGHACGVFGCINALDDPRGCGHGTNCPNCALQLALEDTLKTGTGHRNVEHHTTLVCDGDRREVALLGSTALIPAADQNHLLLCLMDITERKRAEEALRESERRYQRLVENINDAIIVDDREGRLVFANTRFKQWFGMEDREIHDIVLRDYVALEWRQTLRDRHDRRVRGETVPEEFEYEGIRTDGTRMWIEVRVTPVVEDGRIVGTQSALRDITERKRAEEEKAKLEAELQQAQKMESIGRLAGGVAHDFNNLLTVINGYSQLLLGKLRPGDPLRAHLEEIHKAGERASGLTRQLLAFSRKQVLEPRVLDLNQVVEGMRPMLGRVVGEDVELRVELNAEAGMVRADPHQLEQVVLNLVVNARDAMAGGGKLLIETARVERDESYARSHPEARVWRYAMLAVSDNGVGMDEETRQRIFEPFFTTKGVGKGTGLGLSMVQGIVAQSGGYIDVYSEPGQGTSFKIYLPALAEAEADAGRPAAVPALGGKETVLVVEDQAEVRNYAVAVLKAYGYRVITAEDAGEALLQCEWERGRIHLILTDVVMPNVSGRELAGRLEKLRPGIKVLFMSGYTDNVIVHHGVLEEGAEFLQKPFSPEQLAAKVRAVLGPPAPAAHILVADDEAGVRGFLRKVLERGGYEVTEAADGKQALQQARAGRVDLVITDLLMPGQEGIETIQALRKEMPGIGIIAISGRFEGPWLKMAASLGADAVLAKPVGAELLLARVAEVLKSRR